MKLILQTSAAVAALLSAQPAFAATAAAAVDTVVVTATRTAERTDRIGSQITVIDKAMIESRQSVIVSDLLSQTPGVAVTRNGGVGGATQVRIRGAETDHTVVLIDGVKLNDPSSTGGGYNFADLLIGDIDRIEVLRGAQSVLWGSQAIGGVVNVITADPKGPYEASLDAEGGSLSTGYLKAGVSGATDAVAWRAMGGYFTSDGISQFAKARGGREQDGYRNYSATANAKVTVTDQLSLDLRGVYINSRNQFDGFPAPAFVFADSLEYGKTKEWIGYAGVNLDLLDGRFHNRVAFGYTDIDRTNYNPAQTVTTRTFDSLGRNKRWEYQGTFKVTDAWTAVFGAEHERSSMVTASPSSFTPNPMPLTRKARLDGVYLQVHGEVVPGLTLSGGVRYDDHGDFGTHTVTDASAAWALNDGATVLRASFGQGFKAPTLYQLGSEYGNLALNPEVSDTWDAGVEQKLADGRVTVSAAYFHRRTKNQIDFVSCPFGAVATGLCVGAAGLPRFGYYENIVRTKAHGIELDGRAKLTDALTLSGNYTWTHANNNVVGSTNQGKLLARRPTHQAYGEAEYRWPVGLKTAFAVRYVSKSYDDASHFNRLKSYTVADLRASYEVNDHLEVYGRVENLFDEQYETIRNYGEPGRTGYVGLRARFSGS